LGKRVCFFGCLLALLASAAPASAQPHITLAPVKDGKLPNLVSVPAPDARAVALSESLGLLAFCHDRNYADAQVSLVRLDAKGNPAAYATTLKLPKPAALTKVNNYALAAAFHPRLPLLYVWQDHALNYTNPPPPLPPEAKDFDHLCVYNVAKDPPELVVALCRGHEFPFAKQAGGLAVDRTGEHLYVPNIRDAKNLGFERFGRFPLDADGLPRLDDKDAKLPLPARAKRLTELNAAKGTVPPQLTPIEYVNIFPFSYFGAGHTLVSVSRDAVIGGGPYGLVTWRPDDKDVALIGLPIKLPGSTLLTTDPTRPLLYVTRGGTDSVFRVGNDEGYLTLLPLQITFPDTLLTSPPAVLTKGSRLAVGGHYHVYVVGLDKEGRPAKDATRVRVLNPQVRALVYSERFDRLYVGVEVSK
jgi:hypothetical protein